tara:strand:+ start:322 stop:588 length:267 start_codon:yes stop_codon:yes gene_type:complete
MYSFAVGQMARMLTETEVDGFADDDLNDPFTCILNVGDVVEIAGEPISAADLNTGGTPQMIAVKATDIEGLERTTMVDLEDLAPATLS